MNKNKMKQNKKSIQKKQNKSNLFRNTTHNVHFFKLRKICQKLCNFTEFPYPVPHFI